MATTLRESALHFLPLTPQVFQVLLSLHQGPLHGYSIIQDVRERTGGKMRLTASTLYDALARLVEQGLIEETERTDPSGSGDARRRYYRLTRLGRQVAQEEVSRLEQLIRMARTSGVSPKETAR
jgi:DNA-binding PadR family transcriptional regulator